MLEVDISIYFVLRLVLCIGAYIFRDICTRVPAFVCAHADIPDVIMLMLVWLPTRYSAIWNWLWYLACSMTTEIRGSSTRNQRSAPGACASLYITHRNCTRLIAHISHARVSTLVFEVHRNEESFVTRERHASIVGRSRGLTLCRETYILGYSKPHATGPLHKSVVTLEE